MSSIFGEPNLWYWRNEIKKSLLNASCIKAVSINNYLLITQCMVTTSTNVVHSHFLVPMYEALGNY